MESGELTPPLTSHKKGIDFENEFAAFMRKELDWSKTRIRGKVRIAGNNNGCQVDIIASRINNANSTYISTAISCMIVIAAFVFVWVKYGLTGDALIFLLIALSIYAIITVTLLYFYIHYKQQYAWVECKNHKEKVDTNLIALSVSQLNNYKKEKNREYKFVAHYFVSASGYKETALKYAMANGVLCYEKKGDTFIEAEYWD